jgi:hypothetical protein
MVEINVNIEKIDKQQLVDKITKRVSLINAFEGQSNDYLQAMA